MIAYPERAKLAELRHEVARLEVHEAAMLAAAEAAYDHRLEAEYAAEAYDAAAEAARLAVHLPLDRA